MSEKPSERLFNTRYLALVAINLVMSVSFSMVYTTMSTYVTGIGFSVAIAGAITGAFSLSSMIIRPFTGMITDRVNRKTLLVAATAVMALAICGYSFVKSTSALIALRVLHGMAFAVSTTVNMAIIPGIVPEKRTGEAICYFGLSQSLASAVGPSVGLALALRYGFTTTFLVAAALCALGVALALPLNMTDDEARLSSKQEKNRGLHLRDIFVKECLLFAVVEITVASVSGVESSMLALYGKSLGIENIGWYFTISAVTVAVSRLFFGKIIDKKGTIYALCPGVVMMVIGLLLLWRNPAPWMFAAAAVVKTLGASLVKPALQTAAVKSVPAERRGAAVSTYYIGTDIGQGTSPMLAGKIVDMNGGSYGAVFALCTIPLAVSSLILGVVLQKRGKRARQDAKAVVKSSSN